ALGGGLAARGEGRPARRGTVECAPSRRRAGGPSGAVAAPRRPLPEAPGPGETRPPNGGRRLTIAWRRATRHKGRPQATDLFERPLWGAPRIPLSRAPSGRAATNR